MADGYFWALPTLWRVSKRVGLEGHPSTAPPNVRGRVSLMVQDVSLTMGEQLSMLEALALSMDSLEALAVVHGLSNFLDHGRQT